MCSDIGDRPAIDHDGLSKLYHNWCRKIPFDNLFKRLFLRGNEEIEFPGNNDLQFFRNWLKYGTGGTCWSGNGALQTLLASLALYVRKNIGNDVIGVEHGARTVFYGDGKVVRENLTHRQIFDCLADEMGYGAELLARLPEDDKREQQY